jgi:hypothetical protein
MKTTLVYRSWSPSRRQGFYLACNDCHLDSMFMGENLADAVCGLASINERRKVLGLPQIVATW